MLPLLADPSAFEAACLAATLFVIGCFVSAVAVVVLHLRRVGK
jgi:hypothetical protein